MQLVDTHAHIHDPQFADDAGDVVARARAAGVTTILTLGTDLASSLEAIALAERFDAVIAAAGVHPHDAAGASPGDLATLAALLSHPRVALVGEIGLDFYRNLSPRGDQERIFLHQLDRARTAARPVAIHTRDAHDRMLPILSEWSRACGGALPGGRPLGVMHYFTGDLALARRYAELGFLVSIHTSVTHPKAAALREVARELSIDQLVLESDSPYGAPQRYRGRRNEPAYIAESAQLLAGLRGAPPAEIAAATTRNAMRLLGIPVPLRRAP